MLWYPGLSLVRGVFECTYLSKLVYLLDHSSKQSAHTLINQTLHVMDCLLVRQVQSELVLYLEAKKTLSQFNIIQDMPVLLLGSPINLL